MGRPRTDKRERVIRAATEVVYERGFHHSTLADIAGVAGVPVGSVYYFFKSKEALGEAVVDSHVANYAARSAEWERQPTPADRLVAFLQMALDNKRHLSRYGCPIGTLTGELRKEGGALAERANQVFAHLLGWLEAQFCALGQAPLAADHARHLLAAIEGATLLAHSFGDPGLVEAEVARQSAWIRSLASRGEA